MSLTLLDLYDGLQKTAAQQNAYDNDAWAQAAAEHGMTKEAFMNEMAHRQAAQETALVKEAQRATYLGRCMAYGYYDTMSKVAQANAVRDGIPEVHIKIAQQSRVALCTHFIKAANTAAAAEGLLSGLLGKARGAGEAYMGKLRSGLESAGQAIKGREFQLSPEAAATRDMIQKLEQRQARQAAGTAYRSPDPLLPAGLSNLRGEFKQQVGKDIAAHQAGRGAAAKEDLMQAAKDLGLTVGAPLAGVGALGTGIYAAS